MLLYLAIIFSAAISFYIGEVVIVKGLFVRMFGDLYWLYQLIFLVTVLLGVKVLRIFAKRLWQRDLGVVLLFYLASYISYHLTYFFGKGSSVWWNIVSHHKITAVFVPSCLSALIVSVIFVFLFEVSRFFLLRYGFVLKQ